MQLSRMPGEDEILACVDLVGRTGARDFTIGYLHDDVPVDQADWWAHAQYRGARISVEHHISPAEACRALALRILKGGRCRCGCLVALTPDGAFAYTRSHLADGTPWTVQQAKRAGQCLWRLRGQRWDPSCPEPTERSARRR
jgi:hypothetical protein